jgi:hypothetical protein
VYDPLEVARALEEVPTQKRGSIQSLSAVLGISSTTVYRLKTGKGYDLQVIQLHSNAIKPFLEEEHEVGSKSVLCQVEARLVYRIV